jgi:magnesium transporter
MSEIPSNGENLADMMKQGQYWIDILNPTDTEMKALSKVLELVRLQSTMLLYPC